MKKIDQTVLRETGFVAFVTVLLSLLLEAVFLIIGAWDLTVLWGNLFGAAVAVLNFFLMGLTVQAAVQKEEKDAKNTMKFSQSARMLLLFLALALCFLIPAFNLISAAVSLIFPRIAVFLRPITMKNEEKRAARKREEGGEKNE